MLSSMASGAILSKTRAMFGKRLTVADFEALAQKRDVSSAAACLGSFEAYKSSFDGVNVNGIHRLELEILLRQRHYTGFEALCRYELSIGEKFSNYLLLSTEIELIMETLSRVMSPRIEESVVLGASPYLDRRLKLDFIAMGKAQTYDELLEAIKDSVFYAPLKQLKWNPSADIITYENALLSEFYRRIFRIIDEGLSGKDRETLRDMFVSRIDLENLVRVVRFKDYYQSAAPERIRASLIPHGNMTGNIAARLAECADSGAVLALAAGMKPFRGKLRELEHCHRIDELPDRYIMKWSLHEIYFSPHPPVVMISYLNLSELETANIIKIIEGIRYGLQPSQIMELLILPPESKTAEA